MSDAGAPARRSRGPSSSGAPAVAVYFLAIFHRSSLGVAGLAAAERFHITASQLSTFTVLQLLVYAAMQIPVGVLLDRFGPQRLLIAGAVFMTAAQLGFAYTGTYGGALVARVFVGMGDAMVFISVLRLIASWFPPMRSPLLTAFTAMLGQCGALVAAIPLSRALATYGWTATFVASASLGRPARPAHRRCWCATCRRARRPSRSVKDVRTVGRDLRLAWQDPGTRLGLWSHFTTQFAANVMGLLWGFPFFVHAEHRTDAEAGALLTLLVGVFIVGGPLIGGYISPASVAALDGRAVDRRGDGDHLDRRAAVARGRADLAARLLVVTTGLGGPGSMIAFDLARTFAPAVPARLGQRHRQRRRLHRLAARRARHRPGARRGHAGAVDRLRRRRLQDGDVRAVRLLAGRRRPGLAVPLPRPGAPRGHPARDVPRHERPRGVRLRPSRGRGIGRRGRR